MNRHTCWRLTQTTLKAWYEDNTLQMGAGLAYYAVFSIPPLLIISLAVMGTFYSGNSLAYVQQQIEPLIGVRAADAIAAIMQSVRSSRHSSGVTLASVIMLLIGSSAMFAQLQSSMNQIWAVQPRPGSLMRYFLRQRLWSFVIVLGIGLLLLVTLVWSLILTQITGYFRPTLDVFLRVLDFAVSFASVTFLFAAIYKTIPDVRIRWEDVWVGAAVTSALYVASRSAVGFYLARSGFGSAFGAAGSILIVLAWIYYLSQILFLGAEFTKAYRQLRVHDNR